MRTSFITLLLFVYSLSLPSPSYAARRVCINQAGKLVLRRRCPADKGFSPANLAVISEAVENTSGYETEESTTVFDFVPSGSLTVIAVCPDDTFVSAYRCIEDGEFVGVTVSGVFGEGNRAQCQFTETTGVNSEMNVSLTTRVYCAPL